MVANTSYAVVIQRGLKKDYIGSVALKAWCPGSLSEMQVLGPRPKSTEAESLTAGPEICVLPNLQVILMHIEV